MSLMIYSLIRQLVGILAFSIILPGVVLALGGGDGNPDLKTPKESLAKFRSLKYGAFIHWNPSCQTGQEISWCRGRVPREKYDNLYKTFNPVDFDAAEWVGVFKEAGFKYIVFVPKHHDGFCMWDTKTTDYNIMNSPFGRDVTKELAEACKKQGMVFCLYYSIADFYHPDHLPVGYRPFGGDFGGPGYALPEGQKPDFERYVKYMKTHLKELSDICGPVLAWWFDGNWSINWTRRHGQELYAYLRDLQPGGLFSNRIGCAFNGDVYMPTWFASEEKSAGDYAVLEVDTPRFNRDVPWEYTKPAKKTYSWNPGPVGNEKVWIKQLVDSACGDGNFNLGISATPQGRFEPKLVDKLRRVHLWLEYYGESVYGTRGGPYMPTQWYGSTCKGSTVYLHVFKTDKGKLILPPLGKKIVSYSLINGGTVDVRQTKKDVTVVIGENDIQLTDTIVKLKLDGDAVEIEPIEERPVNMGVVVKASSVVKGHGPEMASDGDMSTWWQAEAGAKKGWLEYDLGQDRTFSRAVLFEGKEEAQYNRIRHIQIQAKIDGQWKTLANSHEGLASWPLSIMAPQIRFVPTTARYVRLNILRATDSPIIHEFKLYER